MTRAPKSPAPALRLKWERLSSTDKETQYVGLFAPDSDHTIGFAAATPDGSFVWRIYECGHGFSESLEAAQLAAEAAARGLAMTKLREAESLWPGITKEKQECTVP